LCAVLAGVLMDVLGKAAALTAPPLQIAWLRWVYGLVTLVPVMIAFRVAPGSPWRRVHFARVLLNLVGTICHYYALAHLPLSLVVAIFFIEPLLAMGLAALFLKENLSRLAWLGGLLALTGIATMTLAGDSDSLFASPIDPLAIGVALIGAFAWASLLVATRGLAKSGGARNERENRPGVDIPVLALMFWLTLFTVMILAPMAWRDWQPLAPEAHLAMLGVAVCGTTYGVLFLTVVKRAPLRVVASCSFLSLPLAFLGGFVFFDEAIGALALTGGLLVLLGVRLALDLPARRG